MFVTGAINNFRQHSPPVLLTIKTIRKMEKKKTDTRIQHAHTTCSMVPMEQHEAIWLWDEMNKTLL